MKNKIKRAALVALAAVLCVLTLSACNPKDETSGGSLPVPSLPDLSGKGGPEKPETGEKLVRTDEKGLVRLEIQNGSVSLSFDLECWNELYNTPGSSGFSRPGREGYVDTSALSEGPFQVSGLGGRVKDALIAQVEELDWLGYAYADFVTPAVVFLMEDGGVEWLLADPNAPALSEDDNDPFTSFGRLPLIENIAGLSYEKETEGRGDFTIFATDGDGLIYDLRLPCHMMTIYDTVWACELGESDVDGLPLYGFMQFSQEGGVGFYLMIESYDGEPVDYWDGSYEFILAEGMDYPPATLVLDMKQESGRKAGKIQSSYRFGAYAGGFLDLYLNTGDQLYPSKEEPDIYSFWAYDIHESSVIFPVDNDAELIFWLIDQVPEVYERIYSYGMSPLVTGEVTQFSDGDIGRDIWIGTDLGDKFTREFLYSIGRYGAIYEYDAVENSWTLLHSGTDPGALAGDSFLAYVRVGDNREGSPLEVLVDEVLWVDDLSMPNGYRIENGVEQWVPYGIPEWCDIYLWRYDPDYGMLLAPEGVNGFIFELQELRGGDALLAEIIAAEGIIEFISERYVP